MSHEKQILCSISELALDIKRCTFSDELLLSQDETNIKKTIVTCVYEFLGLIEL